MHSFSSSIGRGGWSEWSGRGSAQAAKCFLLNRVLFSLLLMLVNSQQLKIAALPPLDPRRGCSGNKSRDLDIQVFK